MSNPIEAARAQAEQMIHMERQSENDAAIAAVLAEIAKEPPGGSVPGFGKSELMKLIEQAEKEVATEALHQDPPPVQPPPDPTVQAPAPTPQPSAQEVAMQAIMSKLAELEARLAPKPIEQPVPQPVPTQFDIEQLRSELMLNPTKALETLGLSPAQLQQRMLAETLGDLAPPELKQSAREAALEARLAALEGRLTQSVSTIQNYHQQAQTRAQVGEYVSKEMQAGTLPAVALALAKHDPVRFTEEVFNEIARADQAVRRNEPNAKRLTPADAAKRINERFAPLATIFGFSTNAVPAPVVAAKSEPQKATPTLETPPATPTAGAPRGPWSQVDWEAERAAAVADAAAFARSK